MTRYTLQHWQQGYLPCMPVLKALAQQSREHFNVHFLAPRQRVHRFNKAAESLLTTRMSRVGLAVMALVLVSDRRRFDSPLWCLTGLKAPTNSPFWLSFLVRFPTLVPDWAQSHQLTNSPFGLSFLFKSCGLWTLSCYFVNWFSSSSSQAELVVVTV